MINSRQEDSNFGHCHKNVSQRSDQSCAPDAEIVLLILLHKHFTSKQPNVNIDITSENMIKSHVTQMELRHY